MVKRKEPRTPEMRVLDPASLEILKKAEAEGLDTAFTRMDTQEVQCKFGTQGLCCRVCHMGPCRITPKTPLGVCGADAHTVVARNYLREVVGGAAAHSDHARGLVLLLKKVAQGLEGGYAIRDERALRRNAASYGVEDLDRSKEEIAAELADRMLEDFTSQEKPLSTGRVCGARRTASRWASIACWWSPCTVPRWAWTTTTPTAGHAHRARRRLGRLEDRQHRLGHPLRHPAAGAW